MSRRTVTNERCSGLLEAVQIAAEVDAIGGRAVARQGTVLPIHCATPEMVAELAPKTHHYCDIFTEELLAPLGELALVRIDENTAEKVFINRNKRLLLVSSDGVLAQWRTAGTFESQNRFIAGTPVCTHRGELASVVTARRAHHYAVSNFEGDGGYFETSLPWEIKDIEEGKLIYGDRAFPTREALREYVQKLPPVEVTPTSPPRPILWRGATARVVLVAASGRQISHQYLHGVHSDNIEYL
ncbi:poxin-like [Aricia agestis]|uniref:poxin-like n=1 Tax=Aricia agestis TaxID=91739 RepID=UPI001C204DDA|nr:poxin-like [Aricia agestis]XP_041971577.1 poxin-like [Aricia agestis]